ncbi:Fc.00g031890.m01.CDS01 [Cosmosporella sp. VM-42]
MSGQQPILNNEEIWDDSALIDSWNDALKEYKKYHSIYATGGSVRDLEAKSGSPNVKSEAKSNGSGDRMDELEDGEETTSIEEATAADQVPPTAHHEPSTGQTPKPPLPALPPQAILGSMQDENLKKLLMSWYYAGYYTGLFEGQQQTKQNPQS